MLLEVYAMWVVVAFAFLALGYTTQIYFFSTFGFGLLFFLGSVLMGLNADDGLLYKVGFEEDVVYNYDNASELESTTLVNTVSFESFSHFFFGLLMSFISVIGFVLTLLHTRSGGLSDDV